MSEFLKRLDTVAEGGSTPMGFGTANRKERFPTLACLGVVRGSHSELQSLADEGCLAGVLVVGDDGKTIEGMGNTPWGVWPTSVDPDTVARYREKGCDFLVCSPERLQLTALEEEGLGFFLALPLDLDDRSLRAVESLPVDGVLLTTEELKPPLTVEHLMRVGAVRTMFGKHILVEASPELCQAELVQLRDVGMVGIAVDLEGISLEFLKELQQRIASLPREGRAGPRGRGPSVQYEPLYRPPTISGQEEVEGEF